MTHTNAQSRSRWISRFGLCLGFLGSLALASVSPARADVTLTIDKEPTSETITLAGTVTALDDTKPLPLAERGRRLPSDRFVNFSWDDADGTITVRAWRRDTKAGANLGECVLPPQPEAKKISFSLSSLDCEGRGAKSVVIQVSNGTNRLNYYMASRWALNYGSDMGIALTLVDRWRDPVVPDPDAPDDRTKDKRPAKGFRVNSGLNFYYAISELNTLRFRPIVGVNLLNFDDSDDTFEIGLSAGMLWKLTPLATKDATGLGLAAGVGYNLMEDDRKARWYTFVGFSINFQKVN